MDGLELMTQIQLELFKNNMDTEVILKDKVEIEITDMTNGSLIAKTSGDTLELAYVSLVVLFASSFKKESRNACI